LKYTISSHLFLTLFCQSDFCSCIVAAT
jgi:hypothetical protein